MRLASLIVLVSNMTVSMGMGALRAQAPDLAAMSYNLRLDIASDGEDRWEVRRADVAALLQHYAPHFIGVQEALPQQMEYLDSVLVDYAYIGVGRDDGARRGEFSAIFYDSTRFGLVHGTTFWLSPQPDVPAPGWDAALPRVCTYGAFVDRSAGDTVYVFNTHFDHVGETARARSAELIAAVIARESPPSAAVVLMGDFNLEPERAPIQVLSAALSDSRRVAGAQAYGPDGTFNAFRLDEWPTRRIDYVFVRGLKVEQQVHIDDRRPSNGHWVSDHLPVLVELSYAR